MTTILLLILIFLIIRELLPGIGEGGGIIPKRSLINIKISLGYQGIGVASYTFKIDKEKLFNGGTAKSDDNRFQLGITPDRDGVVISLGYQNFEFTSAKISFNKLAQITKLRGLTQTNTFDEGLLKGWTFSINIFES